MNMTLVSVVVPNPETNEIVSQLLLFDFLSTLKPLLFVSVAVVQFKQHFDQ